MTNVVVLTGAGVSAESGLKTFRDNNGLWENHRVEDVATPEAFKANADLVYRFYNERRKQLLADAEPNQAHLALAKLESALGERFLLVTQNVDNLHEQAGNDRVLHMHGELLSALCSGSGRRKPWMEDMTHTSLCSCCTPANSLRPDIVWFGEIPYFMDEIAQALWQADLFISIGTSGNVYPAAGFVQQAKMNGAHTVELNLEPSQNVTLFDEQHHGPAGEVVPMFVDQLIEKLDVPD